MLALALTSLLALSATTVESATTNQLQVRQRRYAYSIYYICGKYPNQYMSYYPCSPCRNCGSCARPCTTTMYCQTIDINLSCVNGCCKANLYPPITSTTTAPQPNPLCDGREASAGYCQAAGVCPVGFTCTTSNVCCRCLYGTSIGPCVNSKCPDNYQCNINNECCPYQVGK